MEQILDFLQSPTGQQFILITVIIMAIWFVSLLIKRIVPRYIAETSARYRTRKFISFFSYFLIIITILIVYSNQLSGLSIFLGIAGAGIAFALQEIIASIAGFIVIHSANFYKVGDRVLLGGIKGDVIDIGILRTSIMEIGAWVDGDLYNGRMVRVANSFVLKEPVYNYSGDFPFLWDEIIIPIKTSGDFQWAKDEFYKILSNIQGDYAIGAKEHWIKMTEKLMIEKAAVEPMVQMKFDENWISLSLRYVVDYKARRGTKDKIYTAILNLINNSNGRVEIATTAMEININNFSNTKG